MISVRITLLLLCVSSPATADWQVTLNRADPISGEKSATISSIQVDDRDKPYVLGIKCWNSSPKTLLISIGAEIPFSSRNPGESFSGIIRVDNGNTVELKMKPHSLSGYLTFVANSKREELVVEVSNSVLNAKKQIGFAIDGRVARFSVSNLSKTAAQFRKHCEL